jgi:hypothetical protein
MTSSGMSVTEAWPHPRTERASALTVDRPGEVARRRFDRIAWPIFEGSVERRSPRQRGVRVVHAACLDPLFAGVLHGERRSVGSMSDSGAPPLGEALTW